MDIGSSPTLEPEQPGLPPPERLLPDALEPLALDAMGQSGIRFPRVISDYLMNRFLEILLREFPAHATVPATIGGSNVELPGWGFGGGTALVAGHRLGERYSEDIDLVLYMPRDFGRTPRRRACAAFRDIAVELFKEAYPDSIVATAGSDYKSATITLGSDGVEVEIDVGPSFDDPDRREIKAVTSLMGRYALPDEAAHHPGLVTNDVPLVPAAVTACNKLATLHGRATHGGLDVVSARGRDLYDLDSMSRDGATREAIGDEIGRRVAEGRDTPGPLRVKWYARALRAGTVSPPCSQMEQPNQRNWLAGTKTPPYKARSSATLGDPPPLRR